MGFVVAVLVNLLLGYFYYNHQHFCYYCYKHFYHYCPHHYYSYSYY